MAHNVTYAQSLALAHRVIRAGIIHQHHLVHQIERYLTAGAFERLGRIVSGQHHHLLSVDHGAKIRMSRMMVGGTQSTDIRPQGIMMGREPWKR